MGKIGNDLLLFGKRKPWLSLISLVLIAFGGLLVGQFIATFLVMALYDLSFFQVLEAVSDVTAHPEYKIPVYILQGLSAAFAFVLAPWFFLRFIEKKQYSILNPNKKISAIPIVFTILISIVFMAVNFKFAEWNAQMVFPDFLKDVENWMREQEDKLEEVTIFLTTLNNPGEFIIALIVIALIPAIGEEFLFRGLIQNQLQSWTRNAHLAIWLASILFSAMHIQFYGFMPRMLLGVMFGYLYFWSGNLIFPMVGHFVNNGFQLILLYMYRNELTSFNIDDADSVPWTVFISASIITIGLIFYFKRHFSGTNESSSNWQRVFATDQLHQAEIVKAVLNEHHMNPVLINKKDSSYDRFGDIEIHVTTEHVIKARQIIDNDIRFD